MRIELKMIFWKVMFLHPSSVVGWWYDVYFEGRRIGDRKHFVSDGNLVGVGRFRTN